MKYRVDPLLYDGVSPTREKEWQLALLDLNAEADGAEPTLTVTRTDSEGIDIELTGGTEPRTVHLSQATLRTHFRDYRRVIEHLVRSTATGSRQMETLDYAKKLTHDDAGEMVQEALEGVVTVSHAQARRLFTLVFLVASELPESLVTGHRHR